MGPSDARLEDHIRPISTFGESCFGKLCESNGSIQLKAVSLNAMRLYFGAINFADMVIIRHIYDNEIGTITNQARTAFPTA